MGEPDFHTLWNQVLTRWRLRNFEIARDLHMSSKTATAWKLGYSKPIGERRRDVVQFVARYDRTLALAIARSLRLDREVGILLDGHGPSGPELDPHLVAGDIFVVAQQSNVTPRDLTVAFREVANLWSQRGWTLPQLKVALEKLSVVVK